MGFEIPQRQLVSVALASSQLSEWTGFGTDDDLNNDQPVTTPRSRGASNQFVDPAPLTTSFGTAALWERQHWACLHQHIPTQLDATFLPVVFAQSPPRMQFATELARRSRCVTDGTRDGCSTAWTHCISWRTTLLLVSGPVLDGRRRCPQGLVLKRRVVRCHDHVRLPNSRKRYGEDLAILAETLFDYAKDGN